MLKLFRKCLLDFHGYQCSIISETGLVTQVVAITQNYTTFYIFPKLKQYSEATSLIGLVRSGATELISVWRLPMAHFIHYRLTRFSSHVTGHHER